MATYTAFYLDKYLDQFSHFLDLKKAIKRGDVPDGSYICIVGEIHPWYRIRWGSTVPLNDCDVPLTLKTYMMLLGLETT